MTALPKDAASRKRIPLATGLLDYFPDACAAVAHLSMVANDQHNPGEPLHWAREKSTDHDDCLMRHFLERGTVDGDGIAHRAKVAWRALAALQLECEQRASVCQITADAQARGEYDEKAARDLVWSAERSPPRPPDEVYHLYPESIRQRNHALPRLLAESLHDIAKRDYPRPNDWAVTSRTCGLDAWGIAASFGPNVKEHRRVADADELRAAGIGTVEPRHPMQAEADRIIGTELHPLAGPESRL
jgi:hypothetical protein